MLSLPLSQFTHYSWADLEEYLLIYNDHDIQVTYRPPGYDPESKYSLIHDFHIAAYVGQQLYNISTHFSYTVPCPEKPVEFTFTFTLFEDHFDALAEQLEDLIEGIFQPGKRKNFVEEANEEFIRVWDSGDRLACAGLKSIADSFMFDDND